MELYKAFEELGPLPRFQEVGVIVPSKMIHVGEFGYSAVNPRWAEIMEAVRQG
jgi:hypothetical protein